MWTFQSIISLVNETKLYSLGLKHLTAIYLSILILADFVYSGCLTLLHHAGWQAPVCLHWNATPEKWPVLVAWCLTHSFQIHILKIFSWPEIISVLLKQRGKYINIAAALRMTTPPPLLCPSQPLAISAFSILLIRQSNYCLFQCLACSWMIAWGREECSVLSHTLRRKKKRWVYTHFISNRDHC